MSHFICLLLWGALSLIRRNALPLCDQRIQSRNWILSRNSMDISLKQENDNGYTIHTKSNMNMISFLISKWHNQQGEDSCARRHNCWMLPSQGQMLTSNNYLPKFGSTFRINLLFSKAKCHFKKFFSYRCSFLCESFLSRLRGGWR